MNRFDIKKPMVSYFEHNKRERGEIICARLEEGESCALVTDAGMPAISDPGEELVRQCAQRGIQTAAVPGAERRYYSARAFRPSDRPVYL